ncbi:MAG: SigE family RNA polymerase sigma factor [Streptosporangiaceae bacterium]
MYCDTRRKEFADYASAIRPRLRRQAFLLCGDWHEADDLVQDTFALLYRRWPEIDRPGAMDSYTHTVLVRRFLSVRRRLRWQREIPYAEPPDRPQGRDDGADLRLSVLVKLRQLPPRQRTVIVLRFWEDLSIVQTAAAMGISPGTVASANHKALATLRGSLADLLEELPPPRRANVLAAAPVTGAAAW